VAGSAVAAVLAAHRPIETAAEAVTRAFAPDGWEWFAPYYCFLFAGLVALAGVAAGHALRVVAAERGRAWIAPAAVLVLDAAIGRACAPWLACAAPVAAVAFGALLSTGDGYEGPRGVEPIVCLAMEGACAGAALWFPLARKVPATFVLFAALAAFAAVFAGLRADRATRDRLANAGVPLLFLPLVGLQRNPGFAPLLVAAAASVLLYARASAGRRVQNGRAILAMVGFALLWVLPWAFRDMPTADHAGHESQHLGWINAMSYGKLMMADAGFTYGPVREYALAATAWLLGGITLDHVRLAHVATNVVGLSALVYCMHRVCRGRAHLLFLGTLLLVTHSPIASFLVYTHSYSFGWADELRAGLATLAVVVTLDRGRPRLGGALAAAAVLYSHDFGLPAVAATLVAFALEATLPRETRRTVLLRARDWTLGFALVLVPFLAVYAAHGKLLAFFAGYAWTVRVFKGQPWPGAAPNDATFASFASFGALLHAPSKGENALALHVLENFVGPSIVVAGFAQAIVAWGRQRFDRRSILVLALSLLGGMTLRHAFMTDDVFHMLNAQTPALVVLVALMANARRVSFAPLAAAILPVFWLAAGATVPVDARLARVASGEERPSFGAPYHYADLPRAGDERVTAQHLVPVRWVRAHTRPSDPVLFSMWPVSGGTEAFLSHRRNPTSFDKPDELVTRALRRRIAAELERDPPALVVVSDLDSLGDDAARFVRARYQERPMGALSVWVPRPSANSP
jgi:hypothetical protein